MDFKAQIRQVPGFPQPGINFIDITTLLKIPQLSGRWWITSLVIFRGGDNESGVARIEGIYHRGPWPTN